MIQNGNDKLASEIAQSVTSIETQLERQKQELEHEIRT